MPEIDPVILRLEADLADYRRDLQSAERLTDARLGSIEKRSAAAGAAIGKGFSLAKAAAVGFVASIGIDAITGLISRSLDYASSLGEVAQQLGVSTDALQEYRYAATQAGLSQEEMDLALTQLTRRIGEAANGTKEQAEAFEKLGISVRDSSGEMINAGDAIPLIAEALKGVESPAERAAILMDLFGRSGQKLEPLLSGGANAVNNLRDAAHRLGIVLSEKQIQGADEAADKLAAVKQVLEARIAGVVADNAEAIIDLANALANLADKAIKAAAAWADFQKANNARADYQRRANKYLDSRGDLTPEVRAAAGAKVMQRYDERNGWKNSNTGGLFNLRTRYADATYNPTVSFLEKAASGPVGMGRTIGDIFPSAQGMPELNGKMSVELQRLTAELAEATADLTGSIRDRADAAKMRVDAELAADTERLKADEDLTQAERDKQIAVRGQIAATEKAAIEQEAAADLARDTREMEEERLNAALDQLRDEQATLAAKAEIATTIDERRALELRLLDLQHEEERQRLEAAIAAGRIADAAKARASMEERQKAERVGVANSNAGPLARYAASLDDPKAQVEDAVVRQLERVNEGISDAISDAIRVDDPIIKDLLGILLQQVLFKPLAETLSNASGSGGGLTGLFTTIGSAIGSLFGGGRASGGRVSAGTMYRVNEGASPGRVEGFMPDVAGTIVPLGRMNVAGAGSQQSGMATVRLELSGDLDARIQSVSGPVAVEVVRASAPRIIDASASETARRFNRPRL